MSQQTYPGDEKVAEKFPLGAGEPPCPSGKEYRMQHDGKDDPVHHPSHYASGRFEVIDIIEDQLGIAGLRGFCLGNTLKYVMRAGKKYADKTIEDLEKAEWYLHHYIQRVKEYKEEGKINEPG